MIITIGKPRKDGKIPVTYNAGYIGAKSKIIRELIPNRYIKSIDELKAKFPDAEYR